MSIWICFRVRLVEFATLSKSWCEFRSVRLSKLRHIEEELLARPGGMKRRCEWKIVRAVSGQDEMSMRACLRLQLLFDAGTAALP